MKKFLIGLVLVLVIVIIGLVVYSQQPKVVQPVACTEEAKLCPDGVTSVGRQGPNCEFALCPVAQTVDETADWKTYKNDKYGFELKYPSTWSYPFDNWEGGVFSVGRGIDSDNYCVVSVDNSVSDDSSQKEIVNLLGKGYTQTSLKIGDISGTKLSSSSAKAGLTEAVYFSSKNLDYRIGRNRGNGGNLEKECIDSFSQIISSFKFTK